MRVYYTVVFTRIIFNSKKCHVESGGKVGIHSGAWFPCWLLCITVAHHVLTPAVVNWLQTAGTCIRYDNKTIKGGFHQHRLNHRFTELQLFLIAS